ncbi:MAG: hypothetical protein V1927_00315 [Candidatus Omnitrophota bacterium]
MLKKVIAAAAIFTFLLLSSLSFAEEKEGVTVPKEVTKEELLSHMKGLLDHEEGALNFIPELKKVKIGEDNFYTYQGVKLEDIDKEKLMKIFSRIQGEIGRIRTERLNKQLESINQAARASMAAQQAARGSRVAIPPKPPTVIQPPRVPQPPPAQPQIPKPPPAPPRR